MSGIATHPNIAIAIANTAPKILRINPFLNNDRMHIILYLQNQLVRFAKRRLKMYQTSIGKSFILVRNIPILDYMFNTCGSLWACPILIVDKQNNYVCYRQHTT